MRPTTKRVLAALIAVSALGVMAVPAGASVGAKNDKFCETLNTNQGGGISPEDDWEPGEFEYAAGLVRKLAKTGVPGKLNKDLKKLAKLYERIADGESSNEVISGELAFVQKALKRLSKYFAANCAPPPS